MHDLKLVFRKFHIYVCIQHVAFILIVSKRNKNETQYLIITSFSTQVVFKQQQIYKIFVAALTVNCKFKEYFPFTSNFSRLILSCQRLELTSDLRDKTNP